jgi:phosphopantetheine adenylyltransferase
MCSTRRAATRQCMRLVRQVRDDHQFQYHRLLTLAHMSNRLRKSSFTILIRDGQKVKLIRRANTREMTRKKKTAGCDFGRTA